jgi:hypothetical protein
MVHKDFPIRNRHSTRVVRKNTIELDLRQDEEKIWNTRGLTSTSFGSFFLQQSNAQNIVDFFNMDTSIQNPLAREVALEVLVQKASKVVSNRLLVEELSSFTK